jgi:N-acetylneuraminic acid mutarotase
VYTPSSDNWYNVATLSHKRWGAAAAVWNNTVIVAGSYYDPKDSVEQYDPESNTCKSFPNLLVGRCAHALVNLNETLYAIGGSNSGKALVDVEKFDKNSNKWQAVSPLKTARYGLAGSILEVS